MPRRSTRHAPSHARKGVEKSTIAAAALEQIAGGGEASLTLRGLGQALDLDPMTLLHHFGTRENLLRAAADRLLEELDLPPAAGSWEGDLLAVAAAFRSLARRRPRAIELLWRFGATGRADYRQGERVYAAMLTAGLPDDLAARLGCTFYTLVLGLCVAEAGGMLQPAGAEERGELEALSPGTHPATRRLAPMFAAMDVDAAFADAVQAFLAGVRQRVAAQRTGSSLA